MVPTATQRGVLGLIDTGQGMEGAPGFCGKDLVQRHRAEFGFPRLFLVLTETCHHPAH